MSLGKKLELLLAKVEAAVAAAVEVVRPMEEQLEAWGIDQLIALIAQLLALLATEKVEKCDN